jgi:hypothetical protein
MERLDSARTAAARASPLSDTLELAAVSAWYLVTQSLGRNCSCFLTTPFGWLQKRIYYAIATFLALSP